MVQGWESRAHLANKRREEARERKQAKKKTKKITGDVVLTALLHNSLIDVSQHTIEAWLISDFGGKDFCCAHFRAEACRLKRCKFSHDYSIAHMKDVQYSDLEISMETELYMVHIADITSLSGKDYKNLNFLFVDGSCVYDHSNPNNWKQWSERVKTQKRLNCGNNVENKSTPLKTIKESDCHQEEEHELSISDAIRAVDKIDLNLTDVFESEIRARSHISLHDLSSSVIKQVLYFTDDVELCQIYASSKAMQSLILFEESLCVRRKEYLSSITPTGKDLSKLKKQEKKKKLKQANGKISNKKDGHKKVKVCRR